MTKTTGMVAWGMDMVGWRTNAGQRGNMRNVNTGTMDTLSRIQSMLSTEYGLPIEQLAPEQALADLGIDSLTTIEFMFKLEDAFSIRLSEERGDLSTVRDIATLVDNVLQRDVART
jgi:acyl carrier protein